MGAWTELVDFTFTADETSRTFSGLSITEDDFIKIVMTQVNGSASNSDVRLFPNTTAGVSGHDTNTNYHNQQLSGFGSSASAQRENLNRINRTTANLTGSSISYFKISENGKTNTFSNRTSSIDSNIGNIFEYTTSSNLTFNDPITSLTFTAEQTDGLGDGSRIQIYRLDAEKVADITVASDTTQVDISSLSIGKDDEYLLVAQIEGTTGSTTIHNLTPNDLTTATNYYSQAIVGEGSGASAYRQNRAELVRTLSSLPNNLAYAHIKLSEIGAYTHQSYQLFGVGTTTPTIVNSFISSTSEAITSITKLNIVATVSDEIKAGSRFTLYKLK